MEPREQQVEINSGTSFLYFLHQYWIDIQDPRTKHYPMVDVSPWTIANIMFAYYFMVKKIGPQLMKNREAFNLRRIMFVYNVSMVIINAYFFYQIATRIDYGRKFADFKYPDRSDNSPQTLEMIHIGYFYCLSKVMDWLDTTFYVLRKKHSHITFLHLYHHISVPVFAWMFMKINCLVPAAMLFMFMNTFIHSVMYSYYALAAMGPKIQKFLWWKKYITVMQLGQFVVGIIYGALIWFKQTNYPTVWLYVGLTQPPLFFYMFYSFYQQTYNKKQIKVDSQQKTYTKKLE